MRRQHHGPATSTAPASVTSTEVNVAPVGIDGAVTDCQPADVVPVQLGA